MLSAGLCDSVDLLLSVLGIFQPHIVYLLCLATPVDIVLLGVSFLEPADASESSVDISSHYYIPAVRWTDGMKQCCDLLSIPCTRWLHGMPVSN